jgi:hypothetical protein
MEHEDLDKVLAELNLKLNEIQNQISEVRKAKESLSKAKTARADFLSKNSIPLSEATLEVHGGNYFIVGKDETFTYVMNLTKSQAEYLADSLDSELGKAQIEQLLASEIVRSSFESIFKDLNAK